MNCIILFVFVFLATVRADSDEAPVSRVVEFYEYTEFWKVLQSVAPLHSVYGVLPGIPGNDHWRLNKLCICYYRDDKFQWITDAFCVVDNPTADIIYATDSDTKQATLIAGSSCGNKFVKGRKVVVGGILRQDYIDWKYEVRLRNNDDNPDSLYSEKLELFQNNAYLTTSLEVPVVHDSTPVVIDGLRSEPAWSQKCICFTHPYKANWYVATVCGTGVNVYGTNFVEYSSGTGATQATLGSKQCAETHVASPVNEIVNLLKDNLKANGYSYKLKFYKSFLPDPVSPSK